MPVEIVSWLKKFVDRCNLWVLEFEIVDKQITYNRWNLHGFQTKKTQSQLKKMLFCWAACYLSVETECNSHTVVSGISSLIYLVVVVLYSNCTCDIISNATGTHTYASANEQSKYNTQQQKQKIKRGENRKKTFQTKLSREKKRERARPNEQWKTTHSSNGSKHNATERKTK